MCPVATTKNGLPLLVCVRGLKYIKDGNIQSDPRLSETSIRLLNYLGGDCFHKFDKEGHPILVDRMVKKGEKGMGQRLFMQLSSAHNVGLSSSQRNWLGCKRRGSQAFPSGLQ
jgi:hypothetical protein